MARYAFVSTKAIHTVKVCENWALPKPRTRGDILKKSTDFHVRISNDELELIDEKAHRLRMTRSKYVIQAALHQKIITLDNTAIKQLTSELRKIGININQIAILCNMGKLECVHIEDTKSEITKVWEELKKLRQEIKNLNEHS